MLFDMLEYIFVNIIAQTLSEEARRVGHHTDYHWTLVTLPKTYPIFLQRVSIKKVCYVNAIVIVKYEIHSFLILTIFMLQIFNYL